MSKENKNNELQHFPNFVIFQTKDGKVNIDVFFKDETLWLTQKLIAELYNKGRTTITEHLKNIFADGELDEKVVCRDFRQTTKHVAIEGKTQDQLFESDFDREIKKSLKSGEGKDSKRVGG